MSVTDLTLFDLPEEDEAPSLETLFQAFHAAHPEVLIELHTMTLRLVEQGHSRLGIGMLWEVLRWQQMVGDDTAKYHLNNNLRSRYARLLMASDPRLDGVFETRGLTEAGA